MRRSFCRIDEEETTMNVRPLRDRVLVKRIEAQEQRIGGIIVPDTAKENRNKQKSSPLATGA